jgi:alanine-synthesizing transaminase
MESNVFSKILSEKKTSGVHLLDLTLSNPTLAGFRYENARSEQALRDSLKAPYRPDPRGLLPARTAVVNYYQDRGWNVDPEHVILTTGTSEAYGFLFKLLCDPGDEILVPSPSYPLSGILLELESVRMTRYPMSLDLRTGWRWNAGEIARRITPRTKAIVAISPNNPTGSTLDRRELGMLSGLCRDHRMALIVDEVFLDFFRPGSDRMFPSAAGERGCAVFILSGLSKVAGLPQVKLSWIAAGGPEDVVREAVSRLEFIADSYLSVSCLTQEAAPTFLEGCSGLQEQIRSRLRENDAVLRQIPEDNRPMRVFPSDGGWYAVLGLPGGWTDETAALRLLSDQQVIVHPGYFYDFDESQVIVVSLLTPAADFQEGIRRIASTIS